MKKALAVCLSLLLIFPMLPLSAGTDGGAVLAVGDPLPEPDGGEGRYRFPVWVEDAPGAVCGFMMTVTLTGGRIVGAEQGSDSFLTVTMCPITDGVRILFDGIPTGNEIHGETPGENKSEGNPLLWLTVELSGGEDCTVAVSADSLLYFYDNEQGNILTCPSAGCRIDIPAPEAPSGTQASDAPDTQSEPDIPQTEAASEPETEQGTADTCPAPAPVGCREKITSDGLCVELLFAGKGAGKGCPAAWPAVWPEESHGSRVITLRRYETDGFDCLCFSGLPTAGYVILHMADADGRLYDACYTNGAFTGWCLPDVSNMYCYFVQK